MRARHFHIVLHAAIVFAQFSTSVVHSQRLGSQPKPIDHIVTSPSPPWREVVLPFVDTTLFGIQFIDSNHGWVWGSSRNVIKTTDGGTTWSVSQVDSIGSLDRIRFIDINNGWAAGFVAYLDTVFRDSVTLYYTSNGGLQWDQKNLPPGAAERLTTEPVFFDDSTVMYVERSAWFNGLWVTDDRAESWDSLSSDLTFSPYHVAFANRDIGFATWAGGGCIPYISKTYDRGIHWTFPHWSYWDTIFVEYQLGDIYELSSRRPDGVFVGALASWPCEPPPPPSRYAAAALSSDAGGTWLRFYEPFSINTDLFHMGDFLDSSHVWLLKQSGVLLRTTNGGIAWMRDTLQVPMRDFSLLSNNVAWAVAGGGKVYIYDSTISSANIGEYLGRPHQFILNQNFPNPFNPLTKIRYSISSPGKINLKVINVLGEQIVEFVQNHFTEGDYEIELQLSNVSSGVYFLRATYLSIGGFSTTRTIKILLLK